MSTPEEKKLAKLEAILKMADDGLTKEEFVESFEIVVKLVKDLQTTNEQEFELMDKALKTLSENIKSESKSDLAEVRAICAEMMSKMKREHDAKMRSVKDGKPGPKGDRGEPGKDGKEGKKGKDGKDGRDGKDGEAGTTVRVGWGAHPLQVQGLGVLVDKNTRVINFAGSGLASVVRSKSGVVTVTLQAGAGTFYTETPDGLINGSNTTYTVAHDITTVFNLAINGQYLHPTTDYTFTGTTITMTSALDASLSGFPFTITYS